MITPDKWEWYGNAAHFICAADCRFHLATKVGKYIVSTVGQYFPDEGVRAILAQSKGVTIKGRGDEARADYMEKVGYSEIGHNRTFETMVFLAGKRCDSDGCDCGMPQLKDAGELDFAGYNTAGDATKGHMELCLKYAGK